MSRLVLLLVAAATVIVVRKLATADRGGSYDPWSDR